MLRKWELRAYARDYTVKRLAKKARVSAKNIGLALAGKKVPAGALKRLEGWAVKAKYASFSERQYREWKEDQPVKLPFTAARRAELRRISTAITRRPQAFRRIKKWVLREEVRRVGLEKASLGMGVRRGVIERLLRYPYRKYVPPKESAEKIVDWQGRLAAARRAAALAKARALAREKARRTKRKKKTALAGRKLRYLASGGAYVKVSVPARSGWIEKDSNPRTYDKVSERAFGDFLRTPEFKAFGSSTASIYGNCTFLAHDRRSDAVLELHAQAPEMMAGDRLLAKEAAWEVISTLSDLGVMQFIETHDNYFRVKLVEFTLTLKLKDKYSVEM